MKYSEFKAEVEKIGLYLDVREHGIEIVDKYGEEYAYVSKESEMAADTDYENFPKIPREHRVIIFDSLYKLAKTPLAEREEEKRYWLQKIPVPLLDKVSEKKWLWKYMRMAPSNMFGVDTTKIDNDLYKTIFTESEIAQMDITGFEKIEVSE